MLLGVGLLAVLLLARAIGKPLLEDDEAPPPPRERRRARVADGIREGTVGISAASGDSSIVPPLSPPVEGADIMGSGETASGSPEEAPTPPEAGEEAPK
jgi:hypothetical protein